MIPKATSSTPKQSNETVPPISPGIKTALTPPNRLYVNLPIAPVSIVKIVRSKNVLMFTRLSPPLILSSLSIRIRFKTLPTVAITPKPSPKAPIPKTCGKNQIAISKNTEEISPFTKPQASFPRLFRILEVMAAMPIGTITQAICATNCPASLLLNKTIPIGSPTAINSGSNRKLKIRTKLIAETHFSRVFALSPRFDEISGMRAIARLLVIAEGNKRSGNTMPITIPRLAMASDSVKPTAISLSGMMKLKSGMLRLPISLSAVTGPADLRRGRKADFGFLSLPPALQYKMAEYTADMMQAMLKLILLHIALCSGGAELKNMKIIITAIKTRAACSNSSVIPTAKKFFLPQR